MSKSLLRSQKWVTDQRGKQRRWYHWMASLEQGRLEDNPRLLSPSWVLRCDVPMYRGWNSGAERLASLQWWLAYPVSQEIIRDRTREHSDPFQSPCPFPPVSCHLFEKTQSLEFISLSHTLRYMDASSCLWSLLTETLQVPSHCSPADFYQQMWLYPSSSSIHPVLKVLASIFGLVLIWKAQLRL